MNKKNLVYKALKKRQFKLAFILVIWRINHIWYYKTFKR